jgi:hypothetical protein
MSKTAQQRSSNLAHHHPKAEPAKADPPQNGGSRNGHARLAPAGAAAAILAGPSSSPLVIAPKGALQMAAQLASVEVKPVPYDPVAARAALEIYRPQLAALPPETVVPLRLDVQAAALAALGVHAFVTQSRELMGRFESLARAGEFHMEAIEHLRAFASITLYACSQAEAEGAFDTDVRVPSELVSKGTEIEARMQELCEYWFKRDPDIKPLLDALRPGTGYRDLAADLLGYADIYDLRPDVVSADTANYRTTDQADARSVAGQIFGCLSAAMSPKAEEAYNLLLRAATLLLQVYFEVQQVGLALLRYDQTRGERFPSLYTASRKRAKAKAPTAQPEGAPVKPTAAAAEPVVAPGKSAPAAPALAPASP